MAANLAQRTAHQVLDALSLDAQEAGLAPLWDRISRGPATPDPWAGLEDPALMPQEFLVAGAFPGHEPDPQAWFLRLSTRSRTRRYPGGRVASLGPFASVPRGVVPPGWSAVAFTRSEPQVVTLT